mmetsp:Transcript_15329/g.47940  ORF Transcript_15329/g.47940 Transcript_15329/m.47940 type:complete len:523 (+) Transcript_15329:147-1715(+)
MDGSCGLGSCDLPGTAVERRHSDDDFREHFGFLALMLVCGACTVYLMGVLRSILRPFLWALFLVMGLTPAVALVERTLLCLTTLACQGLAAVLRCLCISAQWLCGAASCLRQRPRPPGAKDMELRAAKRPRGSPPASTVIGSAIDERRATATSYLAGSSSAGCEGTVSEQLDRDLGDVREPRPWGPCARFAVHAVAIGIVVAAVICVIGGLVLMVIQSVFSLQDHWAVYKQGARNTAEAAQRLGAHVTGSMPQELADEIASNALTRAEELVSALVAEVLSNAWRFVLEFLMMALYIAFWLSDPMPVGNQMEELFKRYIILKGMACLGYGLCVGVLLHILSVDLAAAFGLAAFLLSFVPEVGAIVALLLPAPVILFDSRLESPAMTLVIATVAQLGLKFVFANVVEVKLVEADQLMKMHPVIILLAVTFFGFIWGPTGMLLSVPLVAYLKVALLSDQVPPRYRDPVLVILEGDRSAPAKYARQRSASSAGRGADGGAGPGCAEAGGLRMVAASSDGAAFASDE